MDLHRFRRTPSDMAAAPSPASLSSNPTSPLSPSHRLGRASRACTDRHSTGSGLHAHDARHAVYSPPAFHRLSTPSRLQTLPPTPTPTSPKRAPSSPLAAPPLSSQDDATSPLSMFSRFSSHAHSPFRPHNDFIVEVDEASGHHPYPPSRGRQYSSPTTAKPYGRHSRRRSSIQYSVGGTPSRLSTKWDATRTPWYRLGFGFGIGHTWRRPRPSQLRRLCFWCGAVGLLLFCFSLVFVLPTDLQRLAPVVIGALLSFISALTILVSFLLQPQNRRYPNELLVYVATCEFGLAVLALARVMAYCSDASYNCQALSLTACSLTTGLELFLLLASVGWFGCAILHLFVSVSNPFANYKSQLQRYHLTVWGGSLVVSLVVPLVLFSDTSQTRFDMTGVEICRAVNLNFPLLPAFATDDERDTRINQWQTLNLEFWGTLVALVVVLVIAAQFILALGWWRSNSGTVIALKARRRMMKRMTTYVHTLNVTWLLLLVVFFTYRSNPGALHHLAEVSTAAAAETPQIFSPVGINVLDAFFHFVLAAKGYFTCVVWLAVNKHCCALGRPMLCQDPFTSRRGSLSYCSDDSDDSDHEQNEFGHGNRGGTVAQTLTQTPSRTPTQRPTLPSTTTATTSSRPSGMTPTSLSFATFANGSGISASTSSAAANANGNANASASFASQNNETLQREIIYYTVCGITKSIRKSSQNSAANSDVYFQQLLVGADRESTLLHHGLGGASPVDTTDPSPRAYCHPLHTLSLTSTANVDTSLVSSIGPNLSFLTSLQATGSRDDVFDSHHLGHSFASTPSVSLPQTRQHRVSMYPVSHVPFELFEQEIELQSHRSSEASLSLSPIFANLRRTAHALYSSSHHLKNTDPTTAVENPRPKMFIDYAPAEFRAIREAFGLSDESYLASFRSTAKERVSAGSSGAFMFFSGDNALIVKSMKEKECRKLVQMIPAYADFITHHPTSRIIRFFGCHRIRLYGRNFYFVVMSNVLHSPIHTPTITEKYDVKGSWIDRQAKLPQTGDLVSCSECNATYAYGRGDASTTYPFHVHRPDTVLKDLDLTRPLLMGRRIARELFEQLERDCEFLNSMGIMDYSLLVGVHKCSHPEQPWRQDFVSFLGGTGTNGDLREDDSSSEGVGIGAGLEPIPEDAEFPEEVYFIGIIDILQEWNWEKQLEKMGKTLIGKSSSGISAVAPDAYCQRFKARVAQVLGLVVDEESESMRETKRLVKQPSTAPSASATSELEHLEFQIGECFLEEEEDPDDPDGRGQDEAIQFEAEAEAISVAMDVEGGRISQRL